MPLFICMKRCENRLDEPLAVFQPAAGLAPANDPSSRAIFNPGDAVLAVDVQVELLPLNQRRKHTPIFCVYDWCAPGRRIDRKPHRRLTKRGSARSDCQLLPPEWYRAESSQLLGNYSPAGKKGCDHIRQSARLRRASRGAQEYPLSC
jgi:hypothetical protein